MSFFLPDRNKPLCQLMVESMTEHVSRLFLASRALAASRAYPGLATHPKPQNSLLADN